MAGHSHWAGIKHKKGKADKQRSKIFQSFLKEITVAAKLGDKDPGMNPRLRSAIQATRSANMPKDNIERAIDKSSINTESNFENLRYEGFGPERVAVIVETLTDNKNRTASNIRTIFQKPGSLGTQGSASHNFNQLGIIKIDKKEISDERILNLQLGQVQMNVKQTMIFMKFNVLLLKSIMLKKELEKEISNFISTEIDGSTLNSIEISKEKRGFD